jgi:hypothetical protein
MLSAAAARAASSVGQSAMLWSRPLCLLHGGDRPQNRPQEEEQSLHATAHRGSNGEGRDTHQAVAHRLPNTALQTARLYVHPLGSASPHSTDPDWSSLHPCCMSPRRVRRRVAHRWVHLPKGCLGCAVTAVA